MLFEVLLYLRNFFPVPGGCKSGEYTISDGTISLDFVKRGQYFLIEGSVFNDGVYQYPAEGLFDETFRGTITPLAIPNALLSTVEEIEKWVEKNESADSVNLSPFNSESFGGYTYSKGTSGDGQAKSWKDVFKGRLNVWRCI